MWKSGVGVDDFCELWQNTRLSRPALDCLKIEVGWCFLGFKQIQESTLQWKRQDKAFLHFTFLKKWFLLIKGESWSHPISPLDFFWPWVLWGVKLPCLVSRCTDFKWLQKKVVIRWIFPQGEKLRQWFQDADMNLKPSQKKWLNSQWILVPEVVLEKTFAWPMAHRFEAGDLWSCRTQGITSDWLLSWLRRWGCRLWLDLMYPTSNHRSGPDSFAGFTPGWRWHCKVKRPGSFALTVVPLVGRATPGGKLQSLWFSRRTWCCSDPVVEMRALIGLFLLYHLKVAVSNYIVPLFHVMLRTFEHDRQLLVVMYLHYCTYFWNQTIIMYVF